jgi:hypothetical protein
MEFGSAGSSVRVGETRDYRYWSLHARTSGKYFEHKRREVLAHFPNHQLGGAQGWPRAGH